MATTQVNVIGVERSKTIFDKTAETLDGHFKFRQETLRENGEKDHMPLERLRLLCCDAQDVLSSVARRHGLASDRVVDASLASDVDAALSWGFGKRGSVVVDVVYIDVMFENVKRRGKAKAGIETLRRRLALLPPETEEDPPISKMGEDPIEEEGLRLLNMARSVMLAQSTALAAKDNGDNRIVEGGKEAPKRVVVKRKRNQLFLGGLQPNHSIGVGSDVRFDVYIC